MPQITHLDALLGSNEQRTSHTLWYGERVAEVADTVVRHEQLQHNWLCQLACKCGVGFVDE